MKHRLAIAGFAAAAAIMAAGTAQAGEYERLRGDKTEVATSRVSLKGVNLSTKKGLALLRHRIRREAVRLCDGGGDSPLAVTVNAEACRREAIRAADREAQRLARSTTAREMAAR